VRQIELLGAVARRAAGPTTVAAGPC